MMLPSTCWRATMNMTNIRHLKGSTISTRSPDGTPPMNCPMADEVLDEVQRNVTDVPGIKACNVELVFDPAWDQSMLSDDARLELGLDDIDSSAGRVDPGAGPDYSKEPNS